MGRRASLSGVAGVVVGVVVGAVVTVLLIVVASSGAVPLAERGPSMPFDLPTLEFADVDLDASLDESSDDTQPGEPRDLPADLRAYLSNLLIVGLFVLVIWGARNLWRQRPDLTWRPTQPRNDFVVMEEIAEAVIADAAAQRAALERGEARNAIVACWSRLEELVTEVGFERDAADTATEFTARVLSRHPVDAGAISGLSALYREARFSTHPMGEPERAAALVALDAIHAGLRSTSPTVPT